VCMRVCVRCCALAGGCVCVCSQHILQVLLMSFS
jgi:hypothetical protein